MSFEQKYLKYKSKYLALKSQVANLKLNQSQVQNGGSFYGKNFDEVLNLTQTPLQSDNYGLKGGNFTKVAEYKKLAALLNSDKEVYTTEVSELSQSAGSEPESENKSESSIAQLTDTPKSDSEIPKSKAIVSETSNSEVKSETPTSESALSETPKSEVKSESALSETPKSEVKSETPASEQQIGGKKAKSNKKYFFDDSDVNLDSTTTDSDLSSLDTDTTDSDEDL